MDIFYGPIAILSYIGLGVPLYFAYGIYRNTRPGFLRAIFLDSAQTLKGRRVKLSDDGKSFVFTENKKGKKYNVVESCIYRTGIWRIPTSYYNLGKISPLDFAKGKSVDDRTDLDYHEATEGNVIRQALQTFDESLLTITSSTMIIAFVVVAANALVYIQLKTMLESIKVGLGILD